MLRSPIRAEPVRTAIAAPIPSPYSVENQSSGWHGSLFGVKAQVKATRPYRTTLREEQAQLTRRRIMETARRLFVQRGYTQVTMQEVAQEAGVAYQTVF